MKPYPIGRAKIFETAPFDRSGASPRAISGRAGKGSMVPAPPPPARPPTPEEHDPSRKTPLQVTAGEVIGAAA
jgi:hypothetical protein